MEKPRVGDEITWGDGDNLIVLGVTDARFEVESAGNRRNEVEAQIRAAMGEKWRETYWKALVKEPGSGKTFYVTSISAMMKRAEIISTHIEV